MIGCGGNEEADFLGLKEQVTFTNAGGSLFPNKLDPISCEELYRVYLADRPAVLGVLDLVYDVDHCSGDVLSWPRSFRGVSARRLLFRERPLREDECNPLY